MAGPGHRRGCLACLAVVSAVVLAGCGGAEQRASTTPQPVATAAATSGASTIIGSLAVDPQDDTIFVGTDRGLFRVDADGGTPQRIAGEFRAPGGSGPVSSSLIVSFAGPGDLFASGHPDASGSPLPANLGLIRSRDGGVTWTPVSQFGVADFHGLQAAGPTVVAFEPDRPLISVSADAGRTFAVRSAPSAAVDIAFDPDGPERMALTTEEGLYTSTDEGKSWRLRDTSGGEQLAWAASGELYRVDGDGVVRVSDDGGERWEQRGSMGAPVTDVAVNADGVLYAGLEGAEVRRSTDGGATWRPYAAVQGR